MANTLMPQLNRKANPDICMHAVACRYVLWKILRCYKIGEINACTYQYIDQLMVKRLVPACKDFAGVIRRYNTDLPP